jgi:hypothetical protein
MVIVTGEPIGLRHVRLEPQRHDANLVRWPADGDQSNRLSEPLKPSARRRERAQRDCGCWVSEIDHHVGRPALDDDLEFLYAADESRNGKDRGRRGHVSRAWPAWHIGTAGKPEAVAVVGVPGVITDGGTGPAAPHCDLDPPVVVEPRSDRRHDAPNSTRRCGVMWRPRVPADRCHQVPGRPSFDVPRPGE